MTTTFVSMLINIRNHDSIQTFTNDNGTLQPVAYGTSHAKLNTTLVGNSQLTRQTGVSTVDIFFTVCLVR